MAVMGVFVAIFLTAIVGGLALAAMMAVISWTMDNAPASAIGRAVGLVLGGTLALTIVIALIGFIWTHSGIDFGDGGTVGDIRCQRYESHFNGKTNTEEWHTIPCAIVGK